MADPAPQDHALRFGTEETESITFQFFCERSHVTSTLRDLFAVIDRPYCQSGSFACRPAIGADRGFVINNNRAAPPAPPAAPAAQNEDPAAPAAPHDRDALPAAPAAPHDRDAIPAPLGARDNVDAVPALLGARDDGDAVLHEVPAVPAIPAPLGALNAIAADPAVPAAVEEEAVVAVPAVRAAANEEAPAPALLVPGEAVNDGHAVPAAPAAHGDMQAVPAVFDALNALNNGDAAQAPHAAQDIPAPELEAIVRAPEVLQNVVMPIDADDLPALFEEVNGFLAGHGQPAANNNAVANNDQAHVVELDSEAEFPLDPEDEAFMRGNTPQAVHEQLNEFEATIARISHAQVPAARAIGNFGGLPTYEFDQGKLWEQIVERHDRAAPLFRIPDGRIKFVKIKDLAIHRGNNYECNFMGITKEFSALMEPGGRKRYELVLGDTLTQGGPTVRVYCYPEPTSQLQIGTPFPCLIPGQQYFIMVLNAEHCDASRWGCGKASVYKKSTMFVLRDLSIARQLVRALV